MYKFMLKWIITLSLLGALVSVVYFQYGQSDATSAQVSLSERPDEGCLSCHLSRAEEEPSLEAG